MHKNRFVIFGGPTLDSFTGSLLKTVMAPWDEKPSFYLPFAQPPLPCDGCGYCKNQPACKYHDLDEFFETFSKAEEIILVFPVYNNSFPAPLKALLDRFQRFYAARFFRNEKPPMAGCRTVTLVMTMGNKNDVTPLILAQLKPLFSICGCTLIKSVVLTGTDTLSPDAPLKPHITQYYS